MPVDKALGKLVLLLFVLGFGVFYGVSISKDGIGRVHGPIDPQQSEIADEAGGEPEFQPAADEVTAQPEQPEQPASEFEAIRPVSESVLVRLIDKIGSLLNYLADRLIRFLVRLGEAVLS